MTQAVSHFQAMLSQTALDTKSLPFMLHRIWASVKTFFQEVAELITSGWDKSMIYIFYKLGIDKRPLPPEVSPKALSIKLHPYQKIATISDPDQFKTCSIELYRAFLTEKDLRLDPIFRNALKEKGHDIGDTPLKDINLIEINSKEPKISDDLIPDKLNTFNEALETLWTSAFLETALAHVRAYVFSNSNVPFNFFTQHGEYHSSHQIGFWRVPITLKGPDESHLDSLKALQKQYQKLSPPEKHLLLEGDVITKFATTKGAQEVYNGMHRIAASLIQKNYDIENLFTLQILQNANRS